MRAVIQRPTLFMSMLFLTALTTVQLLAQQKGPNFDGKGDKEAATYEGMQGQYVQFKIGQNTWVMQLDPKLAATLTGTAETGFIENVRSPLMVRVKAEIDTRQKKATAPVTEIEVISVSETDKPGLIVDGLGGGFAGEQKKGPPPAVASYQITGPVLSYKNDEMLVMGVKIPVAPDAKVSISLSGPAALLAVPPQASTIISYKFPMKTPGRGMLTKIDTTLTEPLPAPKKPMPRGAKSEAKEKAGEAKDKSGDAKEKEAEKEKEGDKPAAEK